MMAMTKGVLVLVATLATLATTAGELYDSALHEAVLDPELCERQLDEVSSFELYDSSFRMPLSILQGNFMSWGDYHKCLNLGRGAGAEPDETRGKHCLLTINALSVPVLPDLPWHGFTKLYRLPWRQINATWTQERIEQYKQTMNMLGVSAGNRDKRSATTTLTMPPMQLGVCVPESCSARQALEPYMHTALWDVQYTAHCRLPGDRPLVAADYVCLAVFSVIGLLTVLSTGYELYFRFVKKDEQRAALSWNIFSVYRNGQQLFHLGERRPGVLLCLDGIRAFSIMWVILGHTLIKMALAGFYNWFDTLTWFGSAQALYITSANISVDTFFMLSGVLLVYTTAHKLTQKALLGNLHLFYLNRLLRLFPLLAAAVLIQAGPMHRISDGANWRLESDQTQYCRDNWWAALLHIQNYYVQEAEECLPHTWYLSVDVQLHIISPLVLIWLLGPRPSVRRASAISGALLSLIASTIFCFVTNMESSSAVIPSDEGAYYDYTKWFYHNTLTRAPVFFIGMAFGYLLHEYRKNKLELSKWVVIVLWVVSAALAATVVYLFYVAQHDTAGNQILANSINSFQRPMWALALGWLIVACVHGYAGPINWFLSLPVWQIISRLSYSMYIFHYPMQWAAAASTFSPILFSTGRMWLHFLNDLSLTFVVSIVFSIVIDAPFATLVKNTLTAISKRPPKPKILNEVQVEQKGVNVETSSAPNTERKGI